MQNKVVILATLKWSCFLIFAGYPNFAFSNDCKFLEPFPVELEFCQEYQRLTEEYRKIGTNIEEIAFYKSLRLLTEEAYKASNFIPWNAYKPAPMTWINWEKGNAIVDTVANHMKWRNRYKLHEKLFPFIHQETMDPMMLTWERGLEEIPAEYQSGLGIRGIVPPRGVRRSTEYPYRPGFFLNSPTEEVKSALKEIVDDEGEPYLTVTAVPFSERVYVQYLSSDKVYIHLFYLVLKASCGLQHFKREPERQKDESPIDFVAKIQRQYVAIHPFHEGQGRMSRWLQDIVLKQLGLPFIKGGRLQNDLTTSFRQYADETRSDIEDTLKRLRDCLEIVRLNPDDMNCSSLYKRGNKKRPAESIWDDIYAGTHSYSYGDLIRKTEELISSLKM